MTFLRPFRSHKWDMREQVVAQSIQAVWNCARNNKTYVGHCLRVSEVYGTASKRVEIANGCLLVQVCGCKLIWLWAISDSKKFQCDDFLFDLKSKSRYSFFFFIFSWADHFYLQIFAWWESLKAINASVAKF